MFKKKPKLIISVRGDERIEILQYAIKYIKESVTSPDIVIVEQDVEQKYSWVKKEGCEYIFAYNPGGFNRSWGFNVGFKNSKPADYYIFSDADLIIPPEMINESIFHMNSRKMPIILPYRTIRFITKDQLSNSISFDHILSQYQLPLYTHDASCGGICVCTKEYFLQAQGYNELYECWGCEDVDWSHKAAQLTGKQLTFNRTKHILLHVRHSTMEAGYQSSKKHQENIVLTRKIWVENKLETIRLLREGQLQTEWGKLNKYVEK